MSLVLFRRCAAFFAGNSTAAGGTRLTRSATTPSANASTSLQLNQPSMLVDLDISVRDHLAPFGDVAADDGGELLRRVADRLAAERVDARAQLGRLEGAHHFIARLRDHVRASAA